MTLDAMHWVWTQSGSKSNARVALLYVADQVRTLACEVRVAQREFMDALGSNSKSTTEAAVRKAIELGELEVIEEASGRRPALYRLPKAVGYIRATSGSSPESGEKDSASSPKTGAPPHTQTTQASQQQAGRPDAFAYIQPLITAMTNAGITVSWTAQARDLNSIADILERAGVDAMVEFARKTQASTRQPIRYATFFLRGGWGGLPPKAQRHEQPPTADAPAPHCGDPDCHPTSRLREIEDEDGLPMLVPCPNCHPQGRRP